MHGQVSLVTWTQKKNMLENNLTTPQWFHQLLCRASHHASCTCRYFSWKTWAHKYLFNFLLFFSPSLSHRTDPKKVEWVYVSTQILSFSKVILRLITCASVQSSKDAPITRLYPLFFFYQGPPVVQSRCRYRKKKASLRSIVAHLLVSSLLEAIVQTVVGLHLRDLDRRRTCGFSLAGRTWLPLLIFFVSISSGVFPCQVVVDR